MKVTLSSVLVDNQTKALAFYTEVLGFVKKLDIPAGEHRWLTLVSPEGHDDVEVVLEPNVHPAAKVYQMALYADGIPATSFASTNVQAEYERLVARGVVFRMPPTQMGPTTVAMFDDTCGNFIQLHQV
jgi:predicted enzyme related to lactoylglutathione lyase